ncbi:MAG: phytanoyl-CoA dioxygenase family protein [Alphaproteobacteria bacterium]|nr:phytanoyl-CoA dioxygenase family protein [Alphaproteobacteria bacterium]
MQNQSISFESSPVSELRAEYEARGIVRLDGFLDDRGLRHVRRDIRAAERLAVADLARNHGGRRVTFFTKNPVGALDAEHDAQQDTSQREDFVTTPYFQASAGKVHVFFEKIAGVSVVNRIGHGLHLHPALGGIGAAVFRNPRLHALLRALGYRRPVCLLSVYIPKHPHGHGSAVRPHQESTFAHTRPLSACVLWVALEDATVENACMYGLPGSHRLPLKFVSRVDHARGRREYVQLDDAFIPPFEAQAANGPYEPVEVRAGGAVLFHGNFVHCSPRNISSRARPALSFQFIETRGAEFSPFNWIAQPNDRALYG